MGKWVPNVTCLPGGQPGSLCSTLQRRPGSLLMHRHSSSLGCRVFVAAALLLLAAPGAGAQASPPDSTLSAPISNLHYEVGADRAALAMRRLHVTTTFDVGAGGVVVLSLPAWTP